MQPPFIEPITLTTPRGHEVYAAYDHARAALIDPKHIHRYTGVMAPLDDALSHRLAQAIRARQVYWQALAESCASVALIHGLGAPAVSLGQEHPAIRPYWQEAEKHRAIAEDMASLASQHAAETFAAIDRALE